MTPKILSDLAAEHLKDIPDRNPIDEMAKEMEDEIEKDTKLDITMDSK
jgi:hypothetical protein